MRCLGNTLPRRCGTECGTMLETIRKQARPFARTQIFLGTLIVIAMWANTPVAQIPVSKDYYEICRRQGYLPGTTPMRRCIEANRSNDLDPLNALVEHELIPPDAAKKRSAGTEADVDFSGAQPPTPALDRTPEELLLGPDYRAPFQGISE